MSTSSKWTTKIFNSSRAVLVAVAAALILNGCAGEPEATPPEFSTGKPSTVDQKAWGKIVEAAKDEGEVVLYVPPLPMSGMIEAFQADNPGINVTVETIPTPELIGRVDQETAVGASGADVVLHSVDSWFRDNDQANKLLSLQVSPASAEQGWNRTDRLGESNYAPVYANPYAIGFTTTGPGKVENVKELLDKFPDARIGLVSPTAAPATAHYYEVLRETYGDDILDRLAKTKHTVVDKAADGMRLLTAGDFDYLFPAIYHQFIDPKAKGAPIDAVVPKEGTSAPRYSTASPITAPHPAAAQVFMNWMMGEQGAKKFVETLPPAAVPVAVEGAISWAEIEVMNPDEWTKDKWDGWIKKQWTPHFG